MNQPPIITIDPVIKVLIDLQLTDQEQLFRGIIQTVALQPEKPQLRDLTIALVATLLSRSGQPWPHILYVMNTLKSRTDEQLRDVDAVAIVNGDRMLLPTGEGRTVKVLDLNTLKEIQQSDEPSLVMTIFSLPEAWKMIQQSLAR